ncbi:MAG: hypothetical protein IH908_05950, partial [Proteobacteria bacterium]|nr:hypothetical protein [Pseudomonadota bacterium]
LGRNHMVGEQLGQGRELIDIIKDMNQVAEGVRSSKVVVELAELHGVEMPITQEVYNVCHKGALARRAFRGLLRHRPGAESDVDAKVNVLDRH